MPRSESQLTQGQLRDLERWQARLDRVDRERAETRKAFAQWVRDTGLSAVARALEISPSAMDQRLRAIEGKRRGS